MAGQMVATVRRHESSVKHTASRPRFNDDNVFSRTLYARVQAQLDGRVALAQMRALRKAGVIVVWFAVSYAALLLVDTLWERLLASVSLAFATAAIGFNIFHDSGHRAMVARASTNLWICRLTCVALGASRYFWHRKHHVLHHQFPNIHEWDDDVESRGFFRLSPRQAWQPRFRNQQRYLFLLYAFNAIEWFFWKDFVQYFRQRVNPFQPVPPMGYADHVEFWITKAVYFTVWIAVPFLILPAGDVIACLLLFYLTFSTILTSVFQLAHLTELVEFPETPRGNHALAEEWAVHQMRTTANFATTSRIATWFTGGLNLQIEHHLFSEKPHTLYPEITPILKQVAAEFDLPYHEYRTFPEAVHAHYVLVRKLGAQPA